MNISDPIADLLTRIRNGLTAKKRFVDIPWSKQKESVVEILEENGFIERFQTKVNNTYGLLRVYLKYTPGRKGVIQGVKRVSKPGCRHYISKDQIPHFYGGLGVPVISTSSGIMSGKHAAEKKVGGELMFLVW